MRGCTHQRSQGSPVAREDVLISVLRWKKELDREAKSMCGFTSVANLSSSQPFGTINAVINHCLTERGKKLKAQFV